MTTAANGTTTETHQKSTKAVPTFDFNAPVEATGADIPEGSYPGCLRKFGEAMWLKSTFKEEEQLRIEVEFAVRLKDGTVETIDGLMNPPTDGKVNRKSNLFKLIKAAMPDAINAQGQFVKGFKLNDLIGKPLVVSVGKNSKEFATYKGVAAPIDGLKYPTAEELAALVSEAPPF